MINELFNDRNYMTYCAALRLKEGMIFASDTRTNAGVDHISTFRKIYTYGVEGERFIVLQTAGNLATSQAVFTQLQNDINQNQEPNLHTVTTLFDAAQLVGRYMREITSNAQAVANEPNNANFTSSFMLGGQIKNQPTELYMIYPEGNCIRATTDTPFFQLGESKYGKPILDRSVIYDADLYHSAQALMLSFDSTIRSNLSVGMPIDMIIYENDSLKIPEIRRIDEHDTYFSDLSAQWSNALRQALLDLPNYPEDYWQR
ncbi:UDP-N-acetylglucosamine--N-acetylmuramyl-(pentapeptide) pyrophosphoryl-undecaprenol N-acetylglucosamine transferase [Psychrobacter sp. 1501(2011)]|nr:UDP-N-acetylglucosamine--N-acetylmuramyl-(pentapeptide) pyrophosphoryl-undecaprenol N-acetylglucosamine transferase [Psychrobacter sp. 1501(2011)]